MGETGNVGYCRDCRWWTGTLLEVSGECRLTSRVDGEVPRPTLAYPDVTVLGPLRKRLSKEQQGMLAGLRLMVVTAPHFGCVQFQARSEWYGEIAELRGDK